MNELDQKKIFAKNLNRLLRERDLTQLEAANAIGVSAQTFNTWCRGIAIPRMDKIQRLSDYFRVRKTELIDDSPSSSAPDQELTEDEQKLVDDFRQLNAIGRREAAKRVSELTRIEEYIKIRIDQSREA